MDVLIQGLLAGLVFGLVGLVFWGIKKAIDSIVNKANKEKINSNQAKSLPLKIRKATINLFQKSKSISSKAILAIIAVGVWTSVLQNAGNKKVYVI
jgi:predicted DNA repair protein MutK